MEIRIDSKKINHRQLSNEILAVHPELKGKLKFSNEILELPDGQWEIEKLIREHVAKDVVLSSSSLICQSKQKEMREDEEKKLREEAEKRKKKNSKGVRFLAKAVDTATEHYDELLGIVERIFYLAIPVLFAKGTWREAILVMVLAIVVWFVKIRKPEPGPIVAMLRADRAAMKTTLRKFSKTSYIE
jgi:hypothetical protein